MSNMMNETNKVLKYLQGSTEELNKIRALKIKYTNYKDFYNQLGYQIMDILNRKEFINLSRKNVDLDLIVDKYF